MNNDVITINWLFVLPLVDRVCDCIIPGAMVSEGPREFVGDTDILDVLTETELLELGSFVRAGMGRFMSGSSPDSLPVRGLVTGAVRGRIFGDQESGLDFREDVSAVSNSADAAARKRWASATLSFLDIISFSFALALALAIAMALMFD
jgi:hypothetical protein